MSVDNQVHRIPIPNLVLVGASAVILLVSTFYCWQCTTIVVVAGCLLKKYWKFISLLLFWSKPDTSSSVNDNVDQEDVDDDDERGEHEGFEDVGDDQGDDDTNNDPKKVE